jgi:hypothetical protein
MTTKHKNLFRRYLTKDEEIGEHSLGALTGVAAIFFFPQK